MKKKSMVRRLRSRRGMTLLEIIIAMAIVAIIAVPMLRIYISSTKSTIISSQLADAEFIAQVQMENLVNLDYIELLTGGYATNGSYVNSSFHNGYDYTVELVPWGIDYSALIPANSTVSYVHMIPYQTIIYDPDDPDDEGVKRTNLVAFFPDGKVTHVSNIGSTIYLDETDDGKYDFYVADASAGTVTKVIGLLSGTDKLAAIANTTMIAAPDKITFSFNPKTKIIFVMTAVSNNYVLTGTYTDQLIEYKGTDQFLNFLVKATVKVYRADDHTKVLAEMTNILYPAFILS